MVDTKAKYLFLEIRTLDVDCGVRVAEAWRRSVRHRDDFNCLGVLIGHSTNQGALDQFAGLMVALLSSLPCIVYTKNIFRYPKKYLSQHPVQFTQ